MNRTLQDIETRRSVRAFKAEQIAEEDLGVILSAGRAAPSSMNRQPWHFTVIQNRELLRWMVKANREIVLASPELMAVSKWIHAPDYDNFYGAPTVILVSGEKENLWHACDCALALENMALAAHALTLGSCIVASIRFLFTTERAEEFIRELNIPAGFIPLYALALGHIEGEPPLPPPRKDNCVNFIR